MVPEQIISVLQHAFPSDCEEVGKTNLRQTVLNVGLQVPAAKTIEGGHDHPLKETLELLKAAAELAAALLTLWQHWPHGKRVDSSALLDEPEAKSAIEASGLSEADASKVAEAVVEVSKAPSE